MRQLLGFLLSFLIIGCETTSYYILRDVPANIGVKNSIERANALSQITWVPAQDLECNVGELYQSGIPVKGAPYSSVKELQTYIGHDVSLYTFVTSTKNPYSLFYTEKVDEYPYKGTNCRLYYGVVCSSAVMYALGITIPYSTLLFEESDLFVKCTRQSPDDIFLCSILLEPGHMLMVVGIERDEDGNIISVDLFEANQYGTHIQQVSYDQFCRRWIQNNICQYEYSKIENNTESVNFISDIDILNDDIHLDALELCPNKGDKSSYTMHEDVIVNILNRDQYDIIELYKSGVLISTSDISSAMDNKVVYSDLSSGEYSIRLNAKGKTYSGWAYFEVLDTTTTIENYGDEIYLKCESMNATPEFISFNSLKNGAALSFYDITDEDKPILIPYNDKYEGGVYIRVIYKGKYGRVFYWQILNGEELSLNKQ